MTTFIRKERQHLAVLHQRLAHLRVNDPGRSDDPQYVPGEANALAWALGVIEGSVEPLEIRVERIEHWRRTVETRLGRIEQDLEEED